MMNDGEMRFEKMSEEVHLKPVEACSSYEVQKINLDQDSKDFVIHEVFHSAIPLQLPNKSLDPDNWQEPSSFAIEPRSERKTLVKSEMAWIKEESSSIKMDFDEEEVKFKPLISLIAPITTSSVTEEQVVMPLVKQETEDVFLEGPSEEKTSCGPLVNFVKEEPHFSLEDHTSSDPLDFYVKKDFNFNDETRSRISTSGIEMPKIVKCIMFENKGIEVIEKQVLKHKDLCKMKFEQNICLDKINIGSLNKKLVISSKKTRGVHKYKSEAENIIIVSSEDEGETYSRLSTNTFISHKCNLCGTELNNLYDLGKHIDKIHKEIETCECDKCTNNPCNYMIVIEKHLKCALCCYETDSRNDLNKHVFDEHKLTEAFFCSICKFFSSTSWGLIIHTDMQHKNIREFRCKVCNFIFPDSDSLRLHYLTVHKTLRTHSCKFCSERSTSKIEIQNHMRLNHRYVKPYQCAFCLRRCKRKNQLLSHIKIHLNKFNSTTPTVRTKCQIKTNFQCAMCELFFKSNNTLIRHMNAVHSRKTPDYKMCRICNKTFENKEEKMKHYSVNKSFKNNKFSCCDCAYSCYRPQDLAKHVTSFHRSQSFKHR